MVKRWVRALVSRFDVDDGVLLAGLGLTSAGSYWVYPPAGLLVPGLVLLWLALAPPPRRG